MCKACKSYVDGRMQWASGRMLWARHVSRKTATVRKGKKRFSVFAGSGKMKRV